MKYKIIVVFFLLGITVLSTEKLNVITTIYPLYDFAKVIGGEYANVELILKPGIDAHSFEPTPKNIIKISNSDIFFYTNMYMEPWAEKIKQNRSLKKAYIVDTSENITMYNTNEKLKKENCHHKHMEINCDEPNHKHEVNGNNHHTHSLDPHIWLDPILAIEIVKNIRDAYIKVDEKNKEYYIENCNKYLNELTKLDNLIKNIINNSNNKIIVYAGHFAFGYFALRYGLEYVSPYEGFSPNAEPTPKKISNIINAINEHSSKYIFYENMENTKIIKTIALETNAEILPLYTIDNITKEDFNSVASYLYYMNLNILSLKKGLNSEF